MKKIYIASDHAGFNLKESIKKKFSSKFEVLDLGPEHSKKSVNYPDYAHKLSKKIKKENIGILVCGSGMGMAMTANKHKNIRAALCYSVKNAKLSRLHNDCLLYTSDAADDLLCYYFLAQDQNIYIFFYLNTF